MPALEASATESFDIRFCGLTVPVSSEVAGVRSACADLLQPSMVVGPYEARPTPPALAISVELGGWTTVDERTRSAMARFPRLTCGDDGPTFTLLEYAPEQRTALRTGEADAEPVLITYDGRAHVLRLGIDLVGREAADHPRGVVRTVKLVMGILARQRGAVVLHGALLTRDEEAHLILGPRGSGKSSLAFLLAVRCGWRFLSDDLVFVHTGDDGRLRASGWPSRIGVGTNVLILAPGQSALAGQTLRRYPAGVAEIVATGWGADQRRRIYLDTDEFLSTFDVAGAEACTPTGVVFPTAEEDMDGWVVSDGPRADWVDENGATIRQLQHSTDHLGLLGGLGSAVTTATSDARLRTMLSRLPTAALTYGPAINRDPLQCWREVSARLTGGDVLGAAS